MERPDLNAATCRSGASGRKLRAVRAVIFDIYGTLLQVGPPPADAVAGWERLFREMLGVPPPLSREAFAARANEVIAREHAAARARGIAWPEVLWPQIVLEVVPSLRRLSPVALEEFVCRQMALERTLRLQPGAAECLRRLRERGVRLGLASNSQAYTQRELETHFRAAGLDPGWFEPALCYRSFEHGFSKPDPHVFQLLSARLAARGIAPEQTLMVGDRLDNDIEPARAFGWQTWWFLPAPGAAPPVENAGDFDALRAELGLDSSSPAADGRGRQPTL